MTSEKIEKLKAHCPDCQGDRWCDVVAQYAKRENDPDNVVWFNTIHRILECRGCETVFHQTDSTFSEDEHYWVDSHTGEEHYELDHTIKQWPSPVKRDRPDWLNSILAVDQDLYDLLSATYTALDNDLAVLAAIGLRTAFDRATEMVSIDPAISFAEKLLELQTRGFIGESEKDALSALTDAGNAAAHRGWKPSADLMDTMASIMESFLHRNFVLNTAAKDLKSKVPPKPKRQRKV